MLTKYLMKNASPSYHSLIHQSQRLKKVNMDWLDIVDNCFNNTLSNPIIYANK